MSIKDIIKKIIGKKKLYRFRYAKKINNYNKQSFVKTICKCKVYDSYHDLFSNISFECSNDDSSFLYFIDTYKIFFYDGEIISNLMLDYEKILKYSLNDYKKMLGDDSYSKELNNFINSLEYLIDIEVKYTKNTDIISSLNGIKNRPANSFKDALQRILFINQVMWQTGHYLNGLGRLDYILNDYYISDVKNKKINNKEVKKLLKEFLLLLHNDYYFKSNSLFGDTGQIIIVGGSDIKGNYFSNDLSYIFIDLIKELQIPDPKILLRVTCNTPRDLIEKSIDCISTGIGCPLFANDEIIIPKLIEFGYDKKDVYNYGTAACWEPFITGKSFDQNNLASISFMEPLRFLNDSELKNIKNINEFIDLYKDKFDLYFNDFITNINNKVFAKDLLLSLFTDECINKGKDVSNGGARYNNYGFTGVGLSNLVNSIQIIKKYIFDEKKYTLIEYNNIVKNNYSGYESLLKEIKNYQSVFGKDDDEIISLANDITEYVSKKMIDLINPLGGKYKFGLSAPSYIDASRNYPSSFDGRKYGEPFNVHISSDNVCSYTELFNFASKLDYSVNRFNGNVIDFFTTPNFIKDNFDKFTDFIIMSISNGFFEMQMNVVSSKMLIDARENPDKYPNLIVRVWGFSAYFNDLPEEYQLYLIERALKSERNYN